MDQTSSELDIIPQNLSVQRSRNIAKRESRVYNAFLDGILIYIITYLLLFTFTEYNYSEFSFRFYAFFYLTFFLYYLIFELWLNKTPAKFITKTKVITSEGNVLNSKQVLLRSLVRLIPFEWISFGLVQSPIGWHDKFSNTIVISEKEKNSTNENSKLGKISNVMKIFLWITIALVFLLLIFFTAVLILRSSS